MPRERLYFFGVHGLVDGDGMSNFLLRNCLATMRQKPMDITRFVVLDDADREKIRVAQGFPLAEAGAARCTKAEPGFRDEHCELFKHAGLEWPPSLTELALNNLRYKLGGLGERCMEVVYFMDQHFPPHGPLLQTPQLEFMDVNSSLARLLNWQPGSGEEKFAELRYPWCGSPRTITGQSKIVMRTAQAGVPSSVRLLEGWEVMALIGWSPNMWKKGGPFVQPEVMCNMAGNAFSGFAVGPVLVATLALMGRPSTSARSPPQGRDGGSEDSDGSESD